MGGGHATREGREPTLRGRSRHPRQPARSGRKQAWSRALAGAGGVSQTIALNIDYRRPTLASASASSRPVGRHGPSFRGDGNAGRRSFNWVRLDVTYNANYLRAMKNSIVSDLFTRTADENYITARWCAANGLETDFFWNAVHSLEKYMKAVLLANGKPADKYGHDIVKMHDEISRFAADVLPTDLAKPANLPQDLWIPRTLSGFLDHLHGNGNADNRYLIYGFDQHFGDLQLLDQAVFAYRRLICPLEERAIPASEPNAPTFSHRDLLKMQPSYFASVGSGMPLDQLIHSREDTPLRHAALNVNFPFAPPGYQHTETTLQSAYHNPVLFRQIFDPLSSTNADTATLGLELANWVLGSIKLPPDVKTQIKDAIKAARQRHPSLP